MSVGSEADGNKSTSNLPGVHLSGPVMGSASYCASADAHRVLRTNCNMPKKGLFLSPLQVPNVFAVLPNGLGRAAQKGNCPLRLGCKYNKSTRLDLTWARHFDFCFMMLHNDTSHDLHDAKLGLSSMIGQNGANGKNKSIHKDLWIQYVVLI